MKFTSQLFGSANESLKDEARVLLRWFGNDAAQIVFISVSFISHDIYHSQDSRGTRRPSLIPPYLFRPLHKHLHTSCGVNAESSPLHMASGLTQSRNLWFQAQIANH